MALPQTSFGKLDEEMTDYVPEEEDGLVNVNGEEAVQGGEDADTLPSWSVPFQR